MEAIFPMEPTSSQVIPKGKEWISQIKWDGVRILTYYNGEQVTLFNRKKNERTHHYPELTDWTYFSAQSAILDGEVIAMGQDGVPSFHEVMRRDGLRNMSKVPLVKDKVPITYMVFDVLYLNGDWVTDLPLRERLDLLKRHLTPTPHIQQVKTEQDGEALFDVIKQYGMEGIVVKDLRSPYLIESKKSTWQKVKVIRDVNAVIGGFTFKNGVANSLLMGLYDDDGSLWYIGHVGTGKLTKEEWRSLTRMLHSSTEQMSPFINNPGKTSDTYFVHPQYVMKIHFAEWTVGRSLRQPSIQGMVDVVPKECTFSREAPEQRTG